jgi:hypothetical protein
MISGHAGSRSAFVFPALDRKHFCSLSESGKARAGMDHVQATLPEIDRLLDAGSRREFWRRARRAMLSGSMAGLVRLMRAAALPDEMQRRVISELRTAATKGEEVAAEIESQVVSSAPPEMFGEEFYAPQICRLNAGLWTRAARDAPDMPRLVYLPAEDFTVALLRDALGKGGPLGRMLLDREARELALDLFQGLPGTWSEAEGTHFFWGLTQKGRMIPLRLHEGELRGKDVRIELTREALLAAFDARRLVPGIILNLLSLLQHGFRCLGGLNQIHYAPPMCYQMRDFCRSLDLEDGPDWGRVAAEAFRDYLCGPLFWFRRDAGSERRIPGSMDSFLREPGPSLAEADLAMRRLSLRRAALLGLPDLYETIVPANERMSELGYLDLEPLAPELDPRSQQ